MRKPLFFLAVVAMWSINVAAADYKLDLRRAWSLGDKQEKMPIPTRVDLYLSGPKVGIDQYPFKMLPSGRPRYSTTNRLEISNLLSILQNHDYEQRITNALSLSGYTYHLLFFQDADKTVIHYYVVDLNTNTQWCSVNPRSDTGSFWFNREIGTWLHARVAIPTNTTAAIAAGVNNGTNSITTNSKRDGGEP